MASVQRIVSPLTKYVSYRAQVRVKGRPTGSKTFTNRKDAKEWAAALESAIADGQYFPSRKAQRTLFAELIERYRRDVLRDPSRGAHLDWWKERFLGLTIAEITPDKVAEARDALMAQTFTRSKERTIKGATLVHAGSYTDIDLTYGSLATYVTQHALAVEGPLREYYLVGPQDTPEESAWRTEIGWPIFQTG
jgi:hypothetical protein